MKSDPAHKPSPCDRVDELCTAQGRKDYDWAHLAARYLPSRVDAKCQTDPSLAVAHGCFWKYHPAKAYAWELRLQDEIGPEFTIDERARADGTFRADGSLHAGPGNASDFYRADFLRDHPDLAAEIRAKEEQRRERKRSKAGVGEEESGEQEEESLDERGKAAEESP